MVGGTGAGSGLRYFLTLKQPRIKPVLCALPQFEQRGGLCHIVEGERLAALSDELGLPGKLMLDHLSLHRSDYVQPHRCGDDPTQMSEDKQTHGLGARKVERPRG